VLAAPHAGDVELTGGDRGLTVVIALVALAALTLAVTLARKDLSADTGTDGWGQRIGTFPVLRAGRGFSAATGCLGMRLAVRSNGSMAVMAAMARGRSTPGS
jgi:K(+)-stimulated pyrophosphate-energized sodium pump